MQKVFCDFYETTSSTSEELFKIVKDVLSRFQLPIDKCRGQCYDGAANVSKHINGLRKKLIHRKSRAIYVHRKAHKLNLVVQDALKNSNDVRNVMGLVQSLIGFICGSSKRLSWFYQFNAFEGNHQLALLRPFSTLAGLCD